MFKIVKNIVLWSILVVYLVIILGFVSVERYKTTCDSVDVIVTGDSKHKFLKRNDIINLIYQHNENLLGYTYDSINLSKLEALIIDHPYVKTAQVFNTIDGKLTIEMEQRDPIIRVINRYNESFYIDKDGVVMPLSEKYSAHVMVANGYISAKYKPGMVVSKAQHKGGNRNIMSELYELALCKERSRFWTSQIQQVFVNKKQNIELFPRVGRHIIVLGTTENLDKKIANLEIMYHQAFSYTGWNKYKKIDLSFDNQVVCTKKINL